MVDAYRCLDERHGARVTPLSVPFPLELGGQADIRRPQSEVLDLQLGQLYIELLYSYRQRRVEFRDVLVHKQVLLLDCSQLAYIHK